MSHHHRFEAFLAAYPPEEARPRRVNAGALARSIQDRFRVTLPSELASFWQEVGSGYFGGRELLFLGDAPSPGQERDIVSWNEMQFWNDLFEISPEQGRPIFFAETCFGDQLGFRHREGECSAILLEPDTLQKFVVAKAFSTLFSEVLTERFALTDRERLEELQQRLGRVPDGWHYAPIISPLVGGTDGLENFHIESAQVHLTTAIATFRAVSRD